MISTENNIQYINDVTKSRPIKIIIIIIVLTYYIFRFYVTHRKTARTQLLYSFQAQYINYTLMYCGYKTTTTVH